MHEHVFKNRMQHTCKFKILILVKKTALNQYTVDEISPSILMTT